MKLFSSKRNWAVAAFIVLLLFLLRPGASRLKSRIIVSISSAVGRPVDIGSLRIRLLPRPGFDLGNLVIYDDAAFGAEPLLRAGEVTAALRLTSLVRGRLEISRLDMTEPSLNLVRGANGHWNVETLLERTAHVPLAPTAKARLEPRPGFPYIEGSSGRINFMAGREKKPYTLTNADFSLWQESEDTWGVRLKAQPTRTDLNLNDTGILRVNGTWQRAAVLRDTPLNFSVEWDRLQLGQMTKFLTGVDQGWRGGMQLEVDLTGTPAKLAIAGDSSIQDFRRYDITSGDALRLAAHCEGQYSSVDRVFSDILCSEPVGSGGIVSVTGAAGLPGSHKYDLLVNAEGVPASAMILLARRAKKNLPDDLVAQGTLRGSVALQRNDELSTIRFDGRGEIENFHLASVTDKAEIEPGTIPFVLTNRPLSLRFAATAKAFHKKFPGTTFSARPQLLFGPFSTGIGKLTAGGWIDRNGYQIVLAGDSEIGKTLAAARLVGISALQTSATGEAQSQIQIRGFWSGWGAGPQNFSGPQVTGAARLRNVRIALRGTDAPVEVLSADVLLADSVRVEKLSAKAANSSWTGSMDLPRGCGNPAQCEIHFSLKSNQVAIGALSAWVSPHPEDRPWYRALEASRTTPSFFATLRASGRIAAEEVAIGGLGATQVAAKLSLDKGSLKITDLRADVLGGKYLGRWETDFRVKPVITTSSGNVSQVSLADAAQVMQDAWISGTASGSYQLSAKGISATEFWQSAEASFRFQARNGTLPHISLEDAEPVKFTDFSGQAQLRAREIDMKDATLDSAEGGVFQLSGIASAGRELQFKLLPAVGSSQGFAITGTLAQPHVSTLSIAEQARLKR